MSTIAYDTDLLSVEMQGHLLNECRRFEQAAPRFFAWLAERLVERAARRVARPLAWAVKPQPLELPDLQVEEIERAVYLIGCLEDGGKRAMEQLDPRRKSRIREARHAVEFLAATREALEHAKLRHQLKASG